MTLHEHQSLPSTRRLLKATAFALAAASLVLVTAVLPAEFGIDPTGLGRRLGLLALAGNAQVAESPSAAPSEPDSATAALAAEAAAVFGAQPGQSFDATAVVRHSSPPRTETMTVTLAPGKGVEVKAMMGAGDSLVYEWSASGEVAVDMHGERPEVKDAYTSYAIDKAGRTGSGRLVAPFAGQHGWYWLNRGQEPVTVKVSVTGFQQKLFRPGHS
jgi:hypothetical protein